MAVVPPGDVALVLHTHLPYLRNHGTWPVGEQWLFEAWGQAWLPITEVLLRLAEEGQREVLTLAVTPVTAHQVADPRLRRDLGTWLASQMWQSEEQRLAYSGPDRNAVRALGGFHWRHFARLLETHERIEASGGLLAVWAELQAAGVIQLLGGPATHPYLPLLSDPALVDAQLATGLASHAVWAGRAAEGMWLPECGYRPAGPVGDPTTEPVGRDELGSPLLARTGPELRGLEEHVAAHGISHVVVDAATVVRAAGGSWRADGPGRHPPAGGPHEAVYDGVLVGDSDVVAFARDPIVDHHAWSAEEGYPGDPWYRDFHARGGFGTHPSWRVTDKASAEKAPYEPARATQRVATHAEHMLGVLHGVLDPRPGAVVVAAFDTELFGHWWFEGPAWLEALLRGLAADPGLRTTTLRGRLARRDATRRLHLPESSWGHLKGHASWVTDDTRWMWEELRRIEDRLRGFRPGAGGELGAELRAQAARELALAQSSDWLYMVGRGSAAGYGIERFSAHVAAFDRLGGLLEAGDASAAARRRLHELAERDDAPRDVAPFLPARDQPSVRTG